MLDRGLVPDYFTRAAIRKFCGQKLDELRAEAPGVEAHQARLQEFADSLKKMPIAVLVGAFGVAAIVSTVLDIPHPIWMPVLGIVGTLLAAGFAGIFVSRWSLGRKPKPA